MAFSSDDIQASVEKLVLSSIRRPYDTLGTRRVDISFSDVQEAAAGVFLLVTSSPFYVAYLGAQTLLELLRNETAIVEKLLSAIEATGRKVFPVKDLTTLSNASTALFELEAAVGRRSQNFKSIESVPAYQRFKTNLEAFLKNNGKNIKADGVIVQTPQEARASIPALLTELRASHAEILRRTAVLAAALEDYSKVNLPALVAAGVISRARQLVQQHVQTLESLGEEERLSVLRPIILDLLSSSAVVKKYGSFTAPTSILGITGIGVPYADALHPATSASVVGDKTGPFAVVRGSNILDLHFDTTAAVKLVGTVDAITQGSGYKAHLTKTVGSFVTDGITAGDIVYVKSGPNSGTRWMVLSVTAGTLQVIGTVIPQVSGVAAIEVWPAPTASVPLALSYVASIEGSAREPFMVDAGVNDTLLVSVAGTPVTFSFFAGAQTAQQICDAMTAQLLAQGLATTAMAEPYLSPLRYEGIVDVTVAGLTGTFALQVGTLDGLGVSVGSLIKILSGPNAGLVLPVTVVPGAPVSYVQGTDPALVAATGVHIQIGAAGRKVRLRLKDDAAALAANQTLTVGTTSQSAAAALLLGFPVGATFTSRKTKALGLVSDLNSKLTKGMAERVFTTVTTAHLGRSKPENASVVTLYRFRGHGTVVAAPGAITITVPTGGLVAASVQLGDVVALRSGVDANSSWSVTAFTDDTLTATGSSTATSASGVELEIGPSLTSPQGKLLRITSGPNTGEYSVLAVGEVPFDLSIDGALPVSRDAFTQPVFFEVNLATECIKISSKDSTLRSRVAVTGFAAELLSSTTLIGEGTTQWFKPPTLPGDLRTGDFLDTYPLNYADPHESFELLLIDRNVGVVQLDHPIAAQSSWNFGDQAPPFARMRSGRVFDYGVLQNKLLRWAAVEANQASFFIDLSRFLNPLIVTKNPTDVQINDAKTRLLALAGILSEAGAALTGTPVEATLEMALETYAVAPVPEVDSLFKTFREKGSDRALDLLIEGQFTTFFSLSLDGASYAGAMQETARLVAQEDLPVSKIDRDDSSASRLTAEVDDVDYEYSAADIDDVQIDPPVD